MVLVLPKIYGAGTAKIHGPGAAKIHGPGTTKFLWAWEILKYTPWAVLECFDWSWDVWPLNCYNTLHEPLPYCRLNPYPAVELTLTLTSN